MTETMTAQAALDRLEHLYSGAVSALQKAVKTFVETGDTPDPEQRANGLFSYPELRVIWQGGNPRRHRAGPMPGCPSPACMRPPSPGRTCTATI